VAPGWDYGFQWWLTRRNGVDVWAGRGFGGQLLFVVPDRDLVGVVNAWNIFGDRTGNLSGAFLDALTAPGGVGRLPADSIDEALRD
jgi:hypothetical protein